MGKTSLKKIIFENSNPKLLLKESLEPTCGIETTDYNWLDINLSIFDISGQEINSFLKEGEKQIKAFERANIVIYMFDYESIREISQEIIEEIENIYKIIMKINSKSKLILIYNKIDLNPQLLQENLSLLTDQIQNLINLKIKPDIYFTSIKQEFIYSIHNTFSEILSSFSEKTSKIKKILEKQIKDYSNVLCLVIDDQNKVITQSKSQKNKINLIYDSFVIFYRLWEENKLDSYLYNESHLFKSNDKIRIVKISRLKFLRSNLTYLVVLSESFNEIKLDELIHNILEDFINNFANKS
ncbi:MAG: GTPase domain-containing protein [Candidatus Lokiarchaeota archaeon]|nr:GTPase domain-containing protein [Candidatus Lokiarchaeota archaeon]